MIGSIRIGGTMAKKSGKGSDAEVKKLTTTVDKLRARLEKAEAATAKWKAESKRLEAETSKRVKQVKKLRKAHARSLDDAVQPQTLATADESTAPPVPDESTAAQAPEESWTVTRLRASAREAGIAGASRMTKAALLESLTEGSASRG
jgi:hypothetical protein